MIAEVAAKYVAIVGPTASGKSKLAMEIASLWPSEIVSCDSVQVYRGFDIGAAKPTPAEQALVPHHLIDICDFHQDFDAFDYAKQARVEIAACQLRGHLPLVVGGTGLYLRGLWGDRFQDFPSDSTVRELLKDLSTEELYAELQSNDPVKAESLHPNDRVRIVRAVEVFRIVGKTHATILADQALNKNLCPPSLLIFINPPREEIRERIAQRVHAMLNEGWILEVEKLLHAGCKISDKPMQSIGYAQIAGYLTANSGMSMTQLEEQIVTVTCQYAKRQVTWFKKLANNIVVQEAKLDLSIKEALSNLQKNNKA